MSLALKEWPSIIQALELGKMIMLIRKGGIHDRETRFSLPGPRALLFPSFEHQKQTCLKFVSPSPVQAYEVGDRITIQSWIEFTHIFEIKDRDLIPALEPYHIWTTEFIQQRYDWKPERPLFCLLCRTYRFKTARSTPYQARYGGCRSFIELAPSISYDFSHPVMPETDFKQHSQQIFSIFGKECAYSE